jgi:uncharacterized protein (TIGR03437 family)
MHPRVRVILAIILCSAVGMVGQGFLVNGGGYAGPAPVAVAPCQLTTFHTGLPSSADLAATAGTVPLPLSLAGISAQALVGSLRLDVPELTVFSVELGGVSSFANIGYRETALTVQIPCELPIFAGQFYTLVVASSTTNAGGAIYLYLSPDAIHIIRKGDTLTNPSQEVHFAPQFLPPAITHADGSNVTPDNPAKPGEAVAIWAVGLGLPSSGTVKSGAANPSPPLTTTVNVDFEFRPNAGPSMPWPPPGSSITMAAGDSHIAALSVPAYFAPGYVGLYQVNVTIPKPPVPLQACGGVFQSNVTVNIGGVASFDGAGICVSQ